MARVWPESPGRVTSPREPGRVQVQCAVLLTRAPSQGLLVEWKGDGAATRESASDPTFCKGAADWLSQPITRDAAGYSTPEPVRSPPE